uniref:Uncharacterized protein n=1 Tax=Oryza sativa subsp. japonica TaxID=39947 RepID=Q5Z9U8_ORYSJ|nr:hypothetical protein [Oryza sativa Japonica Group]
MGPLGKIGIYVGYETAYITKYLEPMTGDTHTVHLADCIFDEDHFPFLWGGNQPLDEKIWKSHGQTWGSMRMIHAPMKQMESVTKSHVHARNAPERLKYQRKLVTLIQSGGLRTKGQELQSLDPQVSRNV